MYAKLGAHVDQCSPLSRTDALRCQRANAFHCQGTKTLHCRGPMLSIAMAGLGPATHDLPATHNKKPVRLDWL
jgi:hypothetical protein